MLIADTGKHREDRQTDRDSRQRGRGEANPINIERIGRQIEIAGRGQGRPIQKSMRANLQLMTFPYQGGS